MRSKAKGFTLIELMIVLVVIAIIAAIAIPSYMEQARKSRRADAIRALGQMQLDLERWRAECSTYADQLSCKDFNGNGTVEAGEGQYPPVPTSDFYTLSVSGASATGYTLTATPKSGSAQASDRCGTYTFTYTGGVLSKSASGGSNCSL